MSIVSNLELFLIQGLHILNWRDCIEILFFSSLVYIFLKWLKQDRHKNLVTAFYSYTLLACGAYYFQFFTISYVLINFFPIALVIFMILHQELLQKNFITLQRVTIPENEFDWFEELTRSCLTALNSNREIICVIERHDSLKNIITTPCHFYADFKKDIFDILLEKQIQGPYAFMWFNQEGKIVGINAYWNFKIDEEWITPEAQTVHKWKQDALFISSKTDALIFKITPLTRTFDIVTHGKLLEEIPSHQAFTIMQRYITTQKITAQDTIMPKQTSTHIFR
jgi:hypothetical protein